MADDPRLGDVRNMSSAKDTAEVFAGDGVGWVFCNLKGACRLLAGLICREREAAQEMREVLREAEWCRGDYSDECPECYRCKSERGHAPDCRLARLIGAPTFVACKNPRCEGGRISTTESITRCPDCNPKDHP